MSLIINMSRVGPNNTGLARFSQVSCQLFHKFGISLEVYCQKGTAFPSGVSVKEMPLLFGIQSKISMLRPIAWLVYSFCRLRRPADKVVSLTHHVLPGSPKQIAVVHDLRPLHFPDSRVQYFYFKYLLPRALKKISAVVTVSEATRCKLIEVYGLEPSKVHVVPNLIDRPRLVEQDDSSMERPYLLMVGATWPHKNAHEVIEMAEFWQSRFRLKILSGATPYREHLKEMVIARSLQDRVDFIGYVPDEALKKLIRKASALVYPSLDEGFGIPPLDALSVGVPVIVSDIPVFREVVGDAGIFVKLGYPASWKNAFLLLDNTEEVANRLTAASEVLMRYNYVRFAEAWRRALTATWPDLFSQDDPTQINSR